MNNTSIFYSKRGFTLAEVLITLGIIGIVAAMTMPSLIAEHREKKTVAQLKKTYSTLQQAYLIAISKHGEPESWEVGNTHTSTNEDGTTQTDYSEAELLLEYLSENMNTININQEAEYTRYQLNGTKGKNANLKNIPNIVLSDGTIIALGYITVTKNAGDIYVILNGCIQNGRCTLGKDIFYFNISFSPAKIIPIGADGSQYPKEEFKNYCNKTVDAGDSGKGCAAWVLYNENMDYLHCNDLDWNTKTRCH